jgi:hypothetical protein
MATRKPSSRLRGAWRQRVPAWALAHLNRKYEKFVAEHKRGYPMNEDAHDPDS